MLTKSTPPPSTKQRHDATSGDVATAGGHATGRPMSYVILLVAVVLAAVGQVTLKHGMTTSTAINSPKVSPRRLGSKRLAARLRIFSVAKPNTTAQRML